jgi:hypothetical protein
MPEPIKVFTVCVDQENGRYMAFLGDDPSKTATNYDRYAAVENILRERGIIEHHEIEPQR